MDQKKNIKRIISLVCATAIVVALAVMPLIAEQNTQSSGPKASILSGNVSKGSIRTELIGGGTLTEEDPVTVSIPAEVKLTKFLVSNGETVTEGAPIAAVDRVTVMSAISQVQETLEYLSEQIQETSTTATTENLSASVGGTVKILYAEEGESVQSIMLEHGALAVLSLDNLMAVDLTTQTNLKVGTEVTVTLPDNSQITGKVVNSLAGEMTVTVEDDNYAIGDLVNVTDENGTVIGSGALYIYSPWNAAAYAGTVSSIYVSEGSKLTAGQTLMTLVDVGYSANYQQTVSQRQEYEKLMLELFKMYQTEIITAPCDGIVSGINEESTQLLSDPDSGYSLSLLANAPNGNDEVQYLNFLAKVTAVGDNGWSLLVNPQPVEILDYMELTGEEVDEAAMTQVSTYPNGSNQEAPDSEEIVQETFPAEENTLPSPDKDTLQFQTAPIYELINGQWQQISPASINAEDILLFAADPISGEFVWIVRIQKTENASSQPSMPSSGFPSGNVSGSVQTPESAFSVYSLIMNDIASVTPRNTMKLEISVDELDIRALQLGMTAQVKINALGGEKHAAILSEIGNTGTNNGGNSKYTVELTMDRTENMLSGMNATAIIVLSSVSDVLTIPADALVDQKNQTIVYTGYDEENGTLVDPVIVKIGSSDGENVEILSGLEDGQTYYYAYYDTLETSLTPDFGRSGLFG